MCTRKWWCIRMLQDPVADTRLRERYTKSLLGHLSPKHDHTQEYKILMSYQNLIICTLTFEKVTSVIDVTCGCEWVQAGTC